jgi:hypothetical protein
MKVCFLDIDGVLNSDRYLAPMRGQKKSWENWIDPSAIATLNGIVAFVPGVRFVLSSAWRLAHTVFQMQALLDGRGFHGQLIDKTPDLGGARSGEIKAWLRTRTDVERYAVLDDQDDAGWGISRHFVQTDGAVGLTDADVARVVEILS